MLKCILVYKKIGDGELFGKGTVSTAVCTEFGPTQDVNSRCSGHEIRDRDCLLTNRFPFTADQAFSMESKYPQGPFPDMGYPTAEFYKKMSGRIAELDHVFVFRNSDGYVLKIVAYLPVQMTGKDDQPTGSGAKFDESVLSGWAKNTRAANMRLKPESIKEMEEWLKTNASAIHANVMGDRKVPRRSLRRRAKKAQQLIKDAEEALRGAP